MNISLSIIIPAYNAELYLASCVDSVMASTFKNFEVLLIDDGSTDGTGALCDELGERYSNIRVFHTENRGLPSARNLGLDNARGEFIGFVDADDLVAPDMFETLVSFMDHDVQLALCGYQRCVRTSLPHFLDDKTANPCKLNQTETAKLIINGGAGSYVWNKLYRSGILDEYSIRFRLDGQGAEDQFFNADYICRCTNAVYIEKKLYFYIMTEGSVMNTFRSNRIVSNRYASLPRAWRYTAEIMEPVSDELMILSQARAAMFYQTVLRKMENPDNDYVSEAMDYIKTYKNTLLNYKWGFKYYISALILSMGYPLWAKIFRNKK